MEIDAEVVGIVNLEDVGALVGSAPERDAVEKDASMHHHDVKVVMIAFNQCSFLKYLKTLF